MPKLQTCFAASVFLWIFSNPSAAFVCTRTASTDADAPALSWPQRQLTFTLQSQGTAQLDPEQTFKVLRQSFWVWQKLILSAAASTECGNNALDVTDLHFHETPTTEANWVGYNFLAPETNFNLLVFRDNNWPYNGQNQDGIIALTTVTYNTTTGYILDADIEFNSSITPEDCNNPLNIANSDGVCFSVDPNTASAGTFDLQNTAVHEIGHFLGLAHCNSVHVDACDASTVMYSSASSNETSKRTLSCDEKNAIILKYPRNKNNGGCTNTIDSNCGYCAQPPSTIPQVDVALKQQNLGRPSCSCCTIPFLCCWWYLAMRIRRII